MMMVMVMMIVTIYIVMILSARLCFKCFIHTDQFNHPNTYGHFTDEETEDYVTFPGLPVKMRFSLR